MKKNVLYVLCFLGALIFVSAGSLMVFYMYFYPPQLSVYPVTDFHSNRTVVLDVYGQYMCSLYNSHKIALYPYIPKSIIHAFLCAEDHAFFKHRGVSLTGIIRSMIKNIILRRFAQGASTITQQTVKLLSNRTKKSLFIKLVEQYKALVLEAHYTKEQIFESYVNIAYFGAGLYGIANAARAFWNKNLSDITIDEAAVLAATVKHPERFCLLYNQEYVKERRNYILKKMYERGYITDIEYESAVSTSIKKPEKKSYSIYDHIKSPIRACYQKYSTNKTDAVVYSTINQKSQELVSALCNQHIQKLQSKIPDIQCGVCLLNNETGAIEALYGGFCVNPYGFNRSSDAKRQVASAIKPLIFYYALEGGDIPETIYIDEPLEIGTWKPRNHNHSFIGEIELAKALMRSNNIISIKVLLKYGVEGFVKLLEKVHLASPCLQSYVSLALGCLEASPLAMASYFRLFSTNGLYKKPYCVKKYHHTAVLFFWKGKALYIIRFLIHP